MSTSSDAHNALAAHAAFLGVSQHDARKRTQGLVHLHETLWKQARICDAHGQRLVAYGHFEFWKILPRQYEDGLLDLHMLQGLCCTADANEVVHGMQR